MEREDKNCTATDKGESDWQTLYTTTTTTTTTTILYVLLLCPYFCINMSFIEVTSVSWKRFQSCDFPGPSMWSHKVRWTNGGETNTENIVFSSKPQSALNKRWRNKHRKHCVLFECRNQSRLTRASATLYYTRLRALVRFQFWIGVVVWLFAPWT